jgi:hypothetical protein
LFGLALVEAEPHHVDDEVDRVLAHARAKIGELVGEIARQHEQRLRFVCRLLWSCGLPRHRLPLRKTRIARG